MGADLVLLVLGINGQEGADPRTIYPAMSLVAGWVLAPLAVLALASGLLLAIRSRWGVLRYWWVATKLLVTATLTALVLLVVVPGLGRVADAAAGPTPVVPDAEQLRYAVTPAISLTLLLLNVVLGVYKPRWRLRTSGMDAQRDVGRGR